MNVIDRIIIMIIENLSKESWKGNESLQFAWYRLVHLTVYDVRIHSSFHLYWTGLYVDV